MIVLFKRGVCCLLCCLIFLSGCYGKSDLGADQLFEKICTVVSIPRCEIYRYAADETQNRYLSRLYSRTDSYILPAIAFCDDYLICLYEGNDLWELHIFRTVSVYDNKRIEEMLISRRDILQNSDIFSYYSEDTQKRVSEAQVFSYRNFVVLAVTDQNEAIQGLLS